MNEKYGSPSRLGDGYEFVQLDITDMSVCVVNLHFGIHDILKYIPPPPDELI
jgi:hypothetical protein